MEGRVKNVGSIMEKASRKDIPLDMLSQKMEDIAGIRITCRFVEDIQKVVELIRSRSGFDMEVITERDYVANTKESGYRSYHIHIKYPVCTEREVKDVIVEVQIRTLAMNFWATIEHSLHYKYGGKIPEELKKRLKSSAEAAFVLDNEMNAIREDIIQAQLIIERKNELVNEILKKLEKLHFIAKLDVAEDLNKKFLEIYEESDVAKLAEFDQQLHIMTRIYLVEHAG